VQNCLDSVLSGWR